MSFHEWLTEIRHTTKNSFYYNRFEAGMTESEIDAEWELLKYEYCDYCEEHSLEVDEICMI